MLAARRACGTGHDGRHTRDVARRWVLEAPERALPLRAPRDPPDRRGGPTALLLPRPAPLFLLPPRERGGLGVAPRLGIVRVVFVTGIARALVAVVVAGPAPVGGGTPKPGPADDLRRRSARLPFPSAGRVCGRSLPAGRIRGDRLLRDPDVDAVRAQAVLVDERSAPLLASRQNASTSSSSPNSYGSAKIFYIGIRRCHTGRWASLLDGGAKKVHQPTSTL